MTQIVNSRYPIDNYKNNTLTHVIFESDHPALCTARRLVCGIVEFHDVYPQTVIMILRSFSKITSLIIRTRDEIRIGQFVNAINPDTMEVYSTNDSSITIDTFPSKLSVHGGTVKFHSEFTGDSLWMSDCTVLGLLRINSKVTIQNCTFGEQSHEIALKNGNNIINTCVGIDTLVINFPVREINDINATEDSIPDIRISNITSNVILRCQGALIVKMDNFMGSLDTRQCYPRPYVNSEVNKQSRFTLLI